MEIRVGHLSSVTHTSWLIMGSAYAAGRLEAGLRWVPFFSGAELVEALGRDEIDIGYSDLGSAIRGIDRGGPFKCVAGGQTDGLLLIGPPDTPPGAGKDPCSVLGQFAGGAVGVPGGGSLFDAAIREILGRCGLREAVAVWTFDSPDQLRQAHTDGGVMAVLGRPDEAVRMRSGKPVSLLLSETLLPGCPSCGLLASESFIEREPVRLQTFVELHEEATAFIRKRSEEAAAVIAKASGVHEPNVMDAFLMAPHFCGGLTGSFVSATKELVRMMKSHGMINGEVPEDRLFNRRFIDAVHPPGDHYRNGLNLCRTRLIRL